MDTKLLVIFNVIILLKFLKNRRFQNNIITKTSMLTQRKLIPTNYDLNLPKINFKKCKSSVFFEPKLETLKFSHQQQTEELTKLQQWENSLPTVKRKRNVTSQSIFYLYRSSMKQTSLNPSSLKYRENIETELSSAGLYMAQLQFQLTRIRKINYMSIYQNVEYCAGVYEIAFNDIFRKIDSIRIILEKNLQSKIKTVEEIRETQLKELTIRRDKIIKSRTSRTMRLGQESCMQQLNENKPKLRKRKTYQESSQNEDENEQNLAESTRSMKIQTTKANASLSKFGKQNLGIQANEQTQRNRVLLQNLQESKLLIEKEQRKIQQIMKMLEKVQQARNKTLSFSLQLGYDVRDQGLIWLLREINDENVNKNDEERVNMKQYQLSSKDLDEFKKNEEKYIPKIAQFPSFLTQQQINFIISKYKNDFKLKKIQQQKSEKQQEEKVIIEAAFEGVRRDRNRKLSMIKQKQLFEKLLQEKQLQRVTGHKYLNEDTLRMIHDSQKIKSTKNQLIYQQTIRKLNRFCIQEIHGKNKNQHQKNASNNNIQVNKLMGEVRKMLMDTKNLREKQQQIKSNEEKQFSDILRKLRNQIYERRQGSDKRNPISVICCLVGWKKAKKILQNQMNISMPASN